MEAEGGGRNMGLKTHATREPNGPGVSDPGYNAEGGGVGARRRWASGRTREGPHVPPNEA